MSMFNENRQVLDYGYSETAEASRRSFFNSVYLWMCVGLVVTACVSASIALIPSVNAVMLKTPAGLISIALMGVGLLAIGLTFNRMVLRISLAASTILFLAYAAFMGALMSFIWVKYQISTIGAAFVVTGGIFGLMSVIGFTTKIDLSKMGSMLLMVVLGLFLASIVNIFMASNALSWAITYISVVVFTGLIAYFTQKLKVLFDEYKNDAVMLPKIALMGSFELYWAFINLFWDLLRILGDRK